MLVRTTGTHAAFHKAL